MKSAPAQSRTVCAGRSAIANAVASAAGQIAPLAVIRSRRSFKMAPVLVIGSARAQISIWQVSSRLS
jgi:hypothetical protein